MMHSGSSQNKSCRPPKRKLRFRRPKPRKKLPPPRLMPSLSNNRHSRLRSMMHSERRTNLFSSKMRKTTAERVMNSLRMEKERSMTTLNKKTIMMKRLMLDKSLRRTLLRMIMALRGKMSRVPTSQTARFLILPSLMTKQPCYKISKITSLLEALNSFSEASVSQGTKRLSCLSTWQRRMTAMPPMKILLLK